MIKASKFGFSISLLIALMVVSGCSQFKNITGTGKNPPDEFAVVERPDLVVPPEFELAPPNPGEPSPQDLASATGTLRALFPDREVDAVEVSAGEAALLRNIEAGSLSSIRSEVGAVDTKAVEKGTLLDEIIEGEERDGSLDGSSIRRTGSEEEDG